MHYGDSCRSQRLQREDGVLDKTYHVNMLKKYIAREPDAKVDVVPQVVKRVIP